MLEASDHAALETLIRAELDTIKDPCSIASGTPLGLNEMGLVDSVSISAAGAVDLKLRLTSPFCHMIGYFQTEAGQRILALPGVTSVTLEGDNGLDWSPTRITAAGQAKREKHLARMRDAQDAPRRRPEISQAA